MDHGTTKLSLEIFEGRKVKKYNISYSEHLDSTKTVELIECAKSTEMHICELIMSKIPIDYSKAKIWMSDGRSVTKDVIYVKNDKLKAHKIAKPNSMDDHCILNGVSGDFKAKKMMSLPAFFKTSTKPQTDPNVCSMYIPLGDVSEGSGKKVYILTLYRLENFTADDYVAVMPYKGILKTALTTFRRKNISGGLVKRVKESTDIRDAFLATVSHELRTPLNGIVGMISMMKDAGPLNTKQEEYLTILMECSHQLMNMMNNLLDFNKIASNRLTLVQNSFDIVKCVEDSVSMISGRIKAKNLELALELGAPPKYLIGDMPRLIQVLTNLLANASKFTEKGKITVRMNSKLQETPDLPFKKWKISFEIEDTGIGVPDVEKEKIFDLFHQSTSLPKELMSAGTGLGLTISKELVRLMGGTIGVKDALTSGKRSGSIFYFHIFCNEEIDLKSLEEGSAMEEIKNSKIMVVDDKLEYRMQIVNILLGWGCQPTVAGSGEEALQYINHGIKFDTIIVDICMPYMNGIEFAQRIRQRELKGHRHIPLLALSSVDLQPKGGIENFDVYMNKPIDQNSLYPLLYKCLMLRDSDLSDSSDSSDWKRPKKPKKDIRILIAEDDHTNAFTVREMLKYDGYDQKKIVIVDNGEKCVKEAKKSKYDVILMDIIMPVMDGIEAIKHIRVMEDRPYIIVLSAAVQNSDKQRCQTVGADGYLSKPIVREELKTVLSSLVV